MDLGRWLDARSGPAPHEDRTLEGAAHFTRAQVEQLVDRKFRDDPRRGARTKERLATVDDARIEDLTRQAFACFHDLVALLACEALPGLGPATASLLLAAQAPHRFVVIDSRVLAALRDLGRFPAGGHFDVAEHWEPYLVACREIARETGRDLPAVGRALSVGGST
ncbi:hypothetical protein [Actinomycetospora atypica]|uniref:Uncharacterized protein n=1 Tax=Actinomycetospora atypica TaxID=1290095 RepID=A0ABV9YHV6_9PSEU